MQIVLDGVKYKDSQNIANVFNSYFDTIVYKQLKDNDTASEFIFNKDSFKSSLSIGCKLEHVLMHMYTKTVPTSCSLT
jgi:hypothetical protein